ncbi:MULTISPECIES: TadE/TadG family type IV pilus assembly protein [unclassified Mesorhizobium]|uniref:TadE/TadG family type IV pilus assembly protein n=1 Tax=unclassified Mesorhizobium TaxID=325217 RepID=UPI000FCA1499|nr:MULTISPECIES: TadE/TadG family type IV pilus assembly protein [unclassified Mesorhizobium]RUZ92443.1 pilus assembly protein [Mesorhizobium sp. M7A.F.Ca.US.003.02.2.1]RUZ03646.1 pilus assembly protein [Mesorhizobium sp. M7A.F.Ca.CA.001.12.2.1]RUZ30716.1 pilus assembly protein [Mesorhizobium sp. M7A.F.Ca.US.007.01.2.1]RUZ46334.1 pilus assembly protein [Mesorhizobium sp. M7A.F.Ca.US.003.02.1.1]RUZ56641.1 pilus assembly protein [Mesorhizobium sp. M7A.F.Ca.US.007.01.1.1]
MRGLAGSFIESRSGSFAPILILAMIPLITAIGFSVDYTSAVQTRSTEQAALDAAILSITTMDTASTKPQRQVAMQASYVANGGQGTATLNSFDVSANGTATAQASASFPMPTVFMQIARIPSVAVGVTSAVNKAPALVEATFKVTGVSGYWNKKMTLYGTMFGAAAGKPLMTIDYAYGKTGDPKGYGTTTVSVLTTDSAGKTVTTVAQKQVCKLVDSSTPAGAVILTDGFQTKYYCVDTMYPADGAGAQINVSQMAGLYLQMDVPSGNPSKLMSNDPTTSNRLYSGLKSDQTGAIDYNEMATGQIVDIFGLVPCGATAYQAWEDGGNKVPAPVSNADFFYNVTGKCDFNKRPNNTRLTQ